MITPHFKFLAVTTISLIVIMSDPPRALAGYTVTKEVQATLTVNGPSGNATANTSQGFVFLPRT